MTRIALPRPEELETWQREQYERFPSNLTRTLLVTGDERLAAALPATANALRASCLTAACREAVVLRVAARQRSAYERFQHIGQARAAGWSEGEIDAIESGADEHLPASIRPILKLVDAVVEASVIDDGILARARAELTDQQLVTLLILIGHYLTVARLLGVLDIDLDAVPDTWIREH